MNRQLLLAYLFLTIAIISEVVATSFLKATREFTRLIPTLVVVAGYGSAFYFLTRVVNTIPMGITYAIWSGVGIVLIALFDAIFYKQMLDLAALAGIALITLGVIVINMFSKSAVSH